MRRCFTRTYNFQFLSLYQMPLSLSILPSSTFIMVNAITAELKRQRIRSHTTHKNSILIYSGKQSATCDRRRCGCVCVCVCNIGYLCMASSVFEECILCWRHFRRQHASSAMLLCGYTICNQSNLFNCVPFIGLSNTDIFFLTTESV